MSPASRPAGRISDLIRAGSHHLTGTANWPPCRVVTFSAPRRTFLTHLCLLPVFAPVDSCAGRENADRRVHAMKTNRFKDTEHLCVSPWSSPSANHSSLSSCGRSLVPRSFGEYGHYRGNAHHRNRRQAGRVCRTPSLRDLPLRYRRREERGKACRRELRSLPRCARKTRRAIRARSSRRSSIPPFSASVATRRTAPSPKAFPQIVAAGTQRWIALRNLPSAPHSPLIGTGAKP